jgi:hypothetical protein
MARQVILLFAMLVTVAVTGCRSASFSYHEERPRHRPVRVYEAPRGHVCSRDCHDHYWDGRRVVVIQSGHRHYPGCGHEWDGGRWVVVANAPVVGKAPAARVHEPPRKYEVPRKKSFSVDHIHSATCGCVWNRREREWMPVEPGHVHGRHCGHIFVEGKWTLPR